MRLMEYLPEKYERSPETVAFQAALQPEMDMLWAARDGFLLQLNPWTASGWGLALWEDALGLRPAAGSALEQRRGRVVAKLRGMGAVTAELLKAVVESFLVDRVEVREFPRENRVEIYFSAADMEFPPREEDLAEAVLEILPAHLGLWLCLRTFRAFRRQLPVSFGGASGTHNLAPPCGEGRTARKRIPTALGGFARPVLGALADSGRLSGPGGGLYRTHITSKRIKEEVLNGKI